MRTAWKIIRTLLIASGLAGLALVLLCFTSAPFWAYYSLGTRHGGIHRPPDYIIMMGGAAIPSQSGLMRTYYTARLGNFFTRSKIIIASPGDTSQPGNSLAMMKQELVLRGISPSRILVEPFGTNTRSQVLNLKERLTVHHAITIVTSPEHMYRAFLSFRKAGFRRIDGFPAFESELESDLVFRDNQLGGRKWMPAIGENLTVRYRFWTQMKYETIIMREYLAIAYYWLRDWI